MFTSVFQIKVNIKIIMSKYIPSFKINLKKSII